MITSIAVTKQSIRKAVIDSIENCVITGCRDILLDYSERMKFGSEFEGNCSDVIVMLNLDLKSQMTVGYDYSARMESEFLTYEKSTAIALNDSVSPGQLIECALGEVREMLAREPIQAKLKAIVKHQLKLRI